MNALIVLPPRRESDARSDSNHYSTRSMRAAAEQEFYDLHGTQSIVWLSHFATWVKATWVKATWIKRSVVPLAAQTFLHSLTDEQFLENPQFANPWPEGHPAHGITGDQ